MTAACAAWSCIPSEHKAKYTASQAMQYAVDFTCTHAQTRDTESRDAMPGQELGASSVKQA